MNFKPISNRAFSLWALVAGLEGFIAMFFVTKEPSEAESALIFGFSFQRLLIIAFVLMIVLFFLGITIAHFYRLISWNETLNRKPGLIRYLSNGILILEIIIIGLLLLVPGYHFPVFSNYLAQLEPLLAWFALVLAQTIILLFFAGSFRPPSLKNWQNYNAIILTLAVIGVVWGTVAITGIGITPDKYQWNEAGVPLLAGQVWIAVGIILIAEILRNKFLPQKEPAEISVFPIFVGIWIVAAVVWIKTPLTPTFNAPGPYLPSKEFYPFVDAALYDLGAQSAIYGNGLFFGNFIDRGLLSGLLALLHIVFGQNYRLVVNAQAALFAVFPAILFLLGKKLHSISAGLMVAALAIFKVSNAITAAKFINTSHPKLMLTEFPTGIVLVFFSLFLVLWFEGNARAYCLAAAGASIGIGILLRTNVFFMFPVVFVLGFLIWRLNWKRAIRDIILVGIAFFITISPWMWRNAQVAGKPLFFLERFNRVIEERYLPQSPLEQNGPVSNPSSEVLMASVRLTHIRNDEEQDLDEYWFIPQHFMHNLITSVLVLPPSPVLDDLRHVLDEYPYWGRMGSLILKNISVPKGLWIVFNLILLSIGFGTAWKRVKYAALVPLMVFLFYNLANAFARTSGGRYIVPIDWVVYFYYVIGLVEIIRFCLFTMDFRTNSFFTEPATRNLNHEDQLDSLGFAVKGTGFRGASVRTHARTPKSGYLLRKFSESQILNWGKAGLVILPFFFVVAMLPVIELASPGEKTRETRAALLGQLEENFFFEKSGFSRPEVEEFLKKQDAVLISGRGFYPRYYSYEEGEPILPGEVTPYTAMEFPRLVFTLLLPNRDRPVLLPTDEPRLYFPDASEVIVGGCEVGHSTVLASYLNYIDAAFVVLLDEPVRIYVRVPDAPLECPLREPVCDNNHNCN